MYSIHRYTPKAGDYGSDWSWAHTTTTKRGALMIAKAMEGHGDKVMVFRGREVGRLVYESPNLDLTGWNEAEGNGVITDQAGNLLEHY